MPGRSLTKEGTVLPPRMLFAGLVARVESFFFCSNKTPRRPAMAVYRSVKAPCLSERGHTVGLRATCAVLLGGLSDGLKRPCIGLRGPSACISIHCLP